MAAIIAWLGWQGLKSFTANTSESPQPQQSVVQATPTPTPLPPAFDSNELQSAWQQVLDQYSQVTTAIVLRDLDTSVTAQIDGARAFRAASTTKMIAASYFLHLVEKGEHSLDEKLGSTTAEYQLQQLINRSNNDSWARFLTLVGRDNEQDYARKLGLHSFNITNNTIAPADLATLLQLLWQGELMNDEHKQLLLSHMQDTIDERWIPPGLPEGAVAYHKYGALEDDIHDEAIIRYHGRTYALVIMSNGNGVYAYDTRAELFKALVATTFAHTK